MADLSLEEHEIVEALGEVNNKFQALDQEHKADGREFAAAIHQAQNIILARVGLRARKEHAPKRKVGFQ